MGRREVEVDMRGTRVKLSIRGSARIRGKWAAVTPAAVTLHWGPIYKSQAKSTARKTENLKKCAEKTHLRGLRAER